MDQIEIEALIRRYLDGTCTPSEASRVETWYNKALETQKPDLSDWNYPKLHGEVLSEIHRRKTRPAIDPVRKLPRYRRFSKAVAAFAIFALIAALGYYFLQLPVPDTAVADIAPGGNRATLTLADGRMVELSEAYSEIVFREGDIAYQDGTPVSDTEDLFADHGPASIDQYRLATPKGGTYQVTLPDGSRVWLNAASTLKYPSQFDDNERVVELEGEAYFEVARTAGTGKSEDSPSGTLLPFKVRTAGQLIEVLGTEFNVSAYTDNAGSVTTLVSGSVRVSDSQTQASLLLIPGEQAFSQPTGLAKRTVDIQPYTAWKEGIFLFDETPLREVMRNIARWYDVEIDYDRLPARQISGIVSRDQPLSSVLHSLAITGNKFTLKERRLLFMDE